jgi:protein associated with RNAse G/E
VRVTALRADGTPYRWWRAVVREATPACIVVLRPSGEPVHEADGSRMLPSIWQNVYWTDRPYNLTESYTAEGEPRRLDLDIASPAHWATDGIAYHDYELDVVKEPDRPPEVRDEDEFTEAIARYGYSPEFQAACWSALREAIQVADSWTWLGCPHFENTP